jgi:CubicO group peptidase (beta-lactamase class C family)
MASIGQHRGIRMPRPVAQVSPLLWLSLALPAFGQDAPPIAPSPPPARVQAPVDAEPPEAARALTREDLAPWLDGFLNYALPRGDIAGAVVVVVKDGEVLVQKGYGYADVEKKTPVDAERTLFRPGSVSKLFTWTAVMQQVEQGKLDLDADVSKYIDFELPEGPQGKPITLRNLMTHTPGFEEWIKELISEDPARLPKTLRDAVTRWIPERIHPAGDMPAYSNYGTALAGHLVERVSGLDFYTYVERHIFHPLGMKSSTFRQPLPKAFEAQMSKGYQLGSDEEPHPFELIPAAPAGSLSATGADMARFMIAHLNDGAFGGARILAEETARQMHGTPLTVVPNLNRMLLGFYETDINGRDVIAHGGDTQYFHSTLHLFLDEGVGLFFSTNSTGKDGAAQPIRAALFDQFADRYFPAKNVDDAATAKTAAEHARMMAGPWIISRRAETSLVSILNLIGGAKVAIHPDDTISISIFQGLNGQPRRWRETAPFVWTEVNGKSRLAGEVVDGRVVRFSVDDLSPFMWFERPAGAKSSAWLVPAAGVALAVLLLTVIMWPVTALVRRHYGAAFPLTGVDRRAYKLSRIGALASALAIIAWGGTVLGMLSNLSMMTTELDWWIVTLHVLGTLAVLAGFAIALWNALVVWRARRRWFSIAWSWLLVLASFVVLWLAFGYHLVGISTKY